MLPFGMNRTTTFTNCKFCIAGKLVEDDIHVNLETGRFIDASNNEPNIIDLEGRTIAPGFLELQSNVSNQAED